jgi:deoxyadenosine/deoxycytidine kinase
MAADIPFSSFSPRHPGKIIELEGGISAGKTTIGKILAEYLGERSIFFPEPRNEAKLLEYISDMKTFGFSFQMLMLRERIKLYQQALEKVKEGFVVIIDRGLMGDLVFAKLQVEKGNMTEDQLQQYFSVLEKEKLPAPDLVVYLRSDPSKSYQRMLSRGTDGSGYTVEYFQDLHRIYEKVVEEQSSKLKILTTSFMEDLMASMKESNIEEGKEFWKLIHAKTHS